MDLISGISNMQQAKVMAQVQMRVAKKMLDIQEFQGAAAVKLIQAAGQGAAKAGDELVAAATSLGSELDVYA